jgi:hypothetical protein
MAYWPNDEPDEMLMIDPARWARITRAAAIPQ